MAIDGTVAFIGAGNMAGALIGGLIESGTLAPEALVASDPRPQALSALAERFGIVTTSDNGEAASTASVVVLSVKPQVLPALLPELGAPVGDALVVSIAAGVRLSVIEAGLGDGAARVVRAMPNTPALVCAGATAIAAGSRATDADLQTAEAIFRSVGIVERVEEAALDAVTGLSGSGPAYVFLLAEAMAAAGAAVGLPPEQAARLSAQTLFGAAKLLIESGRDPAELRRQVTSPGGTTEAGLGVLAELDFQGIVARAIARATERSRELSAPPT
ncbi:MAG: pyrroline-5-carboxylate reductase [Myxococcales bacterium]|nr:pyrroline-5-carboxylate reductase [Myxococcales bacterium]